MSTNHTTHYSLSQWEPDDEILRADFNSDNAKLDAALAAVKATADAAYTPDSKPFVAGTYTGDGAASQLISLGFTPSAVLVTDSNGSTTVRYTSSTSYYGGLAVTGHRVSAIEVTEGGFRVYSSSGSTLNKAANNENTIYSFLAMK